LVAFLGFLSARLRFLRDVPPLPHLLDAFLWLHSFLFRRERFRAMEALFEELRAWPGVTWHLHRFGGIEWRVGATEIGHLHGNGVLDVLLPDREIAEREIGAGRAREHHTHPRTAWISFPIRSSVDRFTATELLRTAFEAQSRSLDR
jgi:hypothetical protein